MRDFHIAAPHEGASRVWRQAAAGLPLTYPFSKRAQYGSLYRRWEQCRGKDAPLSLGRSAAPRGEACYAGAPARGGRPGMRTRNAAGKS